MRVVTVMGPSQAGKTTLVEALAALEDSKPRRLAFFGDAAVTKFDFMGEPWALIDCPGGADNLALAGPALAASDAAVLCVPADVDAAVLAAPYLRILEEAGLPTFIFVNRIDAAVGRVAEIVGALQSFCPHAIALRQVPLRKGEQIIGAVDLISERAWEYHDGTRSSLMELPESMRAREEEARADLLEHLADFDDDLLEQLIEDQKPMTDAVYKVATRVLQHHDLVPALLGSASHGNGILRLMKSLRHEAPGVEALAGRCAKDVIAVGALADNVKHLGKTVLIRAVGQGVAGGARVGGNTIGSITDIDTKTQLGTLQPGEIGLTVKTDHLDLVSPHYTAAERQPAPGWAAARTPNHRVAVEPENERDEARLSGALTRLVEVDPGLSVHQDEQSGKSVLCTQGPLHLRRIADKLDESFGIKVKTETLRPALCETITRRVETHHRHRKQSGGAGQFADVVIEAAPLARGSGFRFEEVVKGGAVPRNYIPSVEAGARDALVEGPHGFPVVDMQVTLKDGKSHSVDSSDFAFRTAGKNAVKEAMAEAGTVVLQPISKVSISVPSVFAGGLVALVTGLKGQVLGFETDAAASGWDVFNALLPQSAEGELFQALGGATRGTAWFTAELDHYEELREGVKAAMEAAH